MEYEMTKQTLDSVLDYLNGRKDISAVTDEVTQMRVIAAALQKKMHADLVDASARLRRQTMKIERLDRKAGEKISLGQFTELGFDSLEIAQALRWCLINRTEMRADMDRSDIIRIVYEIYASWLGSKAERVTAEHPQATSYGPQFWRIYRKLPTMPAPRYEDYSAVASRNPGLAKMIENAATKYCDYSMKALTDFHKNNDAYRNALPKHNGGKWNKELDDRDIYLWRTHGNSPKKPNE